MKKTLVVMMALMLGLAITSCKQGPKAADPEAAAADPAQTLTELIEKSKADGSKWSVDEWKDAYKTAMVAVAPTLKEIGTIMEQFKPKEGEDIDTTKLAEAMNKMKAIEEKFAPVQELLNQFDSISKSYPNGKAVSEDKAFEEQCMKEFGIPDL
jgi:hypothetical protein